MSFYIPKVTIDGIDHLPDIGETELCQYIEMGKPTKSIELAIKLYMAVADRENYYQNNDPTAFGNPDYSAKSGIVTGIGIAANISEETRDGRIVFRKGNRIILEVDKVNRPENYYEANREIQEILDNL